MKRRVVIASLLLCSGVVLVAGVSRAGALQQGEVSSAEMAEAMVVIHNQHRGRVGVDSLSWSPQLADYAREWAKTLAAQGCSMRHRTEHLHGENLYWHSAIRWSDGRREIASVTPQKVVDSWADERRDYDYDQDRCTPGRMCGHYTQVVWHTTREVGCAMQLCPDQGQIWVCNYDPHGNIVGERPY
ncbi:MAG: SCP-like extracellular [Magnetococcales bacterium]|nr:SCP-like extracellular [Magnetococcales bacterium]